MSNIRYLRTDIKSINRFWTNGYNRTVYFAYFSQCNYYYVGSRYSVDIRIMNTKYSDHFDVNTSFQQSRCLHVFANITFDLNAVFRR